MSGLYGNRPVGIVYGGSWDPRSAQRGNTAPGSATYPTANLGLAFPYRLDGRITVRRLWIANGSAVSGNVDVGIYDRNLSLIVSAGSTAQAGTSTLQYFDIADTALGPGLYYLAVSCSNTTSQMLRRATLVSRLRASGVVQMASALALPATFVPAAVANAYEPSIGFTTSATI